MRKAKRMRVLTLALLGLALSAGPVLAMGSDSDSQPAAAAATPYDKAVQLTNAGDYRGAITLLEGVVAADPGNADAWNLLGFGQRKLGSFPVALDAYARALSIEPEHKGANEYLGELYLQMDDLPRARQRLEVLDGACFLPCEEYTELKEKIEAYEASHPPKSS